LTASLTGPTLRDLNAMNLLTSPADDAGYPVPGDTETAQALGYLHANCGHCHNKNGAAWPDTQMLLRWSVGDPDVVTSGVYLSIVDKTLQYWRGGAITLRVAHAQPDASAIVARMDMRGSDNQMPPLATEIVDSAGVDLVRRWIASLPP
jgi:mono/diheme cytochrome c family protein